MQTSLGRLFRVGLQRFYPHKFGVVANEGLNKLFEVKKCCEEVKTIFNLNKYCRFEEIEEPTAELLKRNWGDDSEGNVICCVVSWIQFYNLTYFSIKN